MTATTFPVGVTARGYWNGQPGGDDQRRRHVWTRRKASRTGRNHAALCGTSIWPTPKTGEVFDPDHERACPKCRSIVKAGQP